MANGRGVREAELEAWPLRELLRELVGDGQRLVREEVRLARAELREELRKGARGGAGLGAGGALLYAALLCLAAALVLAGSTFMPAWLAALIVTAIYAGAGLAAVQYGKQKLAQAQPARAVQGLQEERRWASETMRDIKSSRHAHA
jgi:VIT1/CCC1 family predicted Fe2+/Mn2+ transporter